MTKSFIFYGASISFLVGILLASFIEKLNIVEHVYYFGFSLLAILILIITKNKYIKTASLIAVFLFLALWRYDLCVFSPSNYDISYYNFSEQEFVAKIKSDVRRKHSLQSFVVEVSGEKSGRIMIYSSRYPEYHAGDILKINCKLKSPEPIDNFAYDRYLAIDGIYSFCSFPEIKKISAEKNITASIFLFKNRLRYLIDKNMREPSSSIARAMILGDSSLIDTETRELFSKTGISHIVAISGMHIAIVLAIIVFSLFQIGFSRRYVFIVATLIIFLFIILIGSPASAIRAGIMAILAMFALLIGRANSLERVLILTACLILLSNPRLLRDSISFQLSFAALLGIIYLYPYIFAFLDRYLNTKLFKRFKILEIVSVSLAAQIATAPFVWYYFQVFPILGFITNILVLWSLPLIMIIILIALTLANLGLANFFLFVWADILITYLIQVALFVNNLQNTLVNTFLMIVCYIQDVL